MKEKVKYRPKSLIDVNAKILLSNILKKLYTMTKQSLFHRRKAGSVFKNQSNKPIISTG